MVLILKKIYRKFKNFFFRKKAVRLKSNLLYTKDIFKHKPYIIGDYTYGTPQILFDDQGTLLTIGKFCSIAGNVTIFLGGNHRTDWITTYPFNILYEDFSNAKDFVGHPATKGDVIIGNDVWIGNDVTILSGVKIGDGAVIGTGSMITKNVGPYEIWGGNPGKLIKKRFEQETIDELLKLQWWNWHPDMINEKIQLLCSHNIRHNLKQLKNESNS